MSCAGRGGLLAGGELRQAALLRLAASGLSVCDAELRFQLRRRGHSLAALPDALSELQRRGLIEAEMHYRLTPAGADLVPPDVRPAAIAISSVPWSNPPLPAPNLAPTRGRRAAARPGSRRAQTPTELSAAKATLNGS